MGTSITIRNVPEDTHAELTARAARNGQSLQEYLRAQLAQIVSQPDMHTLMERIRQRVESSGTVLGGDKIVEYIHRDRR